MTELLRPPLPNVESPSPVQRATRLKRRRIAKFLAGKQSPRLDCADRLAVYSRIESRACAPKRRSSK